MNLREQETDELALIRNGINGMGYVAQHHIRCTPYLCRQMQLYRIKPIVTYRNYFDTLVSLDDMFLEWRPAGPGSDLNFFDDGLPSNYVDMDREDRLHLLADRSTVFYIQFYLTWKKCEAMGLVEPLWVSYEKDFQGDKTILAERIAEFVGEKSHRRRQARRTVWHHRSGQGPSSQQGDSRPGQGYPAIGP